MPPDGPEYWPEKYSKHQWLVFYRVNEMSLQGAGQIDGRGEPWWNLPCKPHRVYKFQFYFLKLYSIIKMNNFSDSKLKNLHI